jgi:putative ABC transport system substrate-binding protein
MPHLRRRRFITLLGGAAAAWPFAARAQQPAMPVVGYLNNGSPEADASRLAGLRRGLATLAAKAATTSIPIVFNVGNDPVQLGLVASLNRPGGNLTGFNNVANELGAKGLALLHELVPGTETIGFLENPNNLTFELTTRDVLAAASVIGVKVQTLKAATDREIDAAFVSLVQERTGALLVGNDLFFNNRIDHQ